MVVQTVDEQMKQEMRPKIHQIKGYIQTIYLVEYTDKLLLLDSGCRCDVPVVQRFIEYDLDRSMLDLKLVVVTHAHPDHSGGAQYYQDLYQIPLASSKRLNLLYLGLSGRVTHLADIVLTYYVASKKQAGWKNVAFPRHIDVDYVLAEGDHLPMFPDWQVLETPGHTLADLSIYHTESSTAYVADCIIGTKKWLSRPYPIHSPEQYRKSLGRFIELGIQNFLLAHYGEHKIPSAEIQTLIDGAPEKPRKHLGTLRAKLEKRLGV